ncbi:MAG: hypothetical protein PW735_09100 [Acidobacteriaceae bacterium]|nr:hypothetical protein [Acidobacteriaceae bacterium]
MSTPYARRVRAYFAPVDRNAKEPTIFDAAQDGRFDVSSPPEPWVDLGWIEGFERSSDTKIEAVDTGTPLTATRQVRSKIGAMVTFTFATWNKLQLALSAGVQQMNLLPTSSGASTAGSGGTAATALTLLEGSTSTTLIMSAADASTLVAGDLVVVDVDYTGEIGFVGAGVSGAYVKSALSDLAYVRRVSLNVGRVATVQEGVVTLEAPLLAGAPLTAMKAQKVLGYCDREGSTFFQEWSALFVAEGQQGERVLWHYPRLQAAIGPIERQTKIADGFTTLGLQARFRALPVLDAVDAETIVCFRSFLSGKVD